MGPLAAGTRAHEHHGHSGPRSGLGQSTVHGFSSKKGNESLGWLNGPKNYMDWPPRIWSRSPADPCWTPMNGEPRPHSDYPVNSSLSTIFCPSRKNVAWLSPSVLSKKECLRDDDHKDEPTLDQTPATHGGLREVGLTRRPNVQT